MAVHYRFDKTIRPAKVRPNAGVFIGRADEIYLTARSQANSTTVYLTKAEARQLIALLREALEVCEMPLEVG